MADWAFNLLSSLPVQHSNHYYTLPPNKQIDLVKCLCSHFQSNCWIDRQNARLPGSKSNTYKGVNPTMDVSLNLCVLGIIQLVILLNKPA